MASYYGVITTRRTKHDTPAGLELRFHDVPGCVAKAATTDELTGMAKQALTKCLTALHASGTVPPTPSSYADVLKAHRKDKGFQGIARITASPDTKNVRINLSMKEGDLEFIDAMAKASGMDRSAFIGYAAHLFSTEWNATDV
jgi:predicted RNase H-like HicB family nuclease